MEQLLEKLRLGGIFDEPPPASIVDCASKIKHLRRSLRKAGWHLTTDGYIEPVGDVELTTGGRDALDEHLDRIRRSTDDPGLLVGTAKDLLEATAKFVLQRLDIEMPAGAKFGWLLFTARDRLQLNPQDVPQSMPGAEHIRKVL